MEGGHQKCWCYPPSTVDSGQWSMGLGHLGISGHGGAAMHHAPTEVRGTGRSRCCLVPGENQGSRWCQCPGILTRSRPVELSTKLVPPQGSKGRSSPRAGGRPGVEESMRAVPWHLLGPWPPLVLWTPGSSRPGQLAYEDGHWWKTVRPARTWPPLCRLLWPGV